MRLITARYLLPMDRPPIEDGAILLDGPCIRAVGRRRDLAGEPVTERLDLGDAILLPGLVNVHTHLELTAFRGRVSPGEDFAAWIVNLLRLKRDCAAETYRVGAREGVAEVIRSGTTCVGEILSAGASSAPLRASGLRGIVYRELLGLEEGRVEEIIEQAEAEIRTLGEAFSTDRLVIGLAPHAPYSLSRRLLSASADLARREGLRAAVHVAESPAEMEYLLTGAGPIAERLLPFTGFAHIPAPVVGERPLAYLKACGLWGRGLLLVHGVHLTETECREAAEAGAAVAYCPRSNAFLQVGHPPLATMLEAGLPVGLGTDSLASNTSLSLWDELRFAATDQPGLLTPAGWMAMATLGGARALGLEAQVGSLTPGKRADLIAVRAPSRVQDLAEYLVWEGDPDRIALCLVDGAVLPGGPGADLAGMSRAMAGPAKALEEWR